LHRSSCTTGLPSIPSASRKAKGLGWDPIKAEPRSLDPLSGTSSQARAESTYVLCMVRYGTYIPLHTALCSLGNHLFRYVPCLPWVSYSRPPPGHISRSGAMDGVINYSAALFLSARAVIGPSQRKTQLTWHATQSTSNPTRTTPAPAKARATLALQVRRSP